MRHGRKPLASSPCLLDSLRVRTVHLFMEFCEQLSALLRAQLSLQLFESERDDVVVVSAGEFRIGSDVEP